MMDPNPHVPAREKKTMTVAAELPPECPVYSHPLPHGDPPGQLHATVADRWVRGKKFSCPREKDRDPLPCYFL
jgi:hypothetical protein